MRRVVGKDSWSINAKPCAAKASFNSTRCDVVDGSDRSSNFGDAAGGRYPDPGAKTPRRVLTRACAGVKPWRFTHTRR